MFMPVSVSVCLSVGFHVFDFSAPLYREIHAPEVSLEEGGEKECVVQAKERHDRNKEILAEEVKWIYDRRIKVKVYMKL